ncbi:cytochrome C assembly family protein [Ramlibacter sp.]|uniref:cytochrome C assembly family protein n=1 Tax=Ramlibacter sp. TaxID=1917967 RepID=UPI003D0FBA3A
MILASASPAGVALTLAAAVAYALPAAGAARLSEGAARGTLIAAWLLHGLALVWGLLGDAPHFGWAQALSFTVWLMLTIYIVERRMFPQLQARWAMAALGTLALLPALVFPGRPVHIGTSPWLPIHLALGIASYGMVAAAVLHAFLMRRAERQMRSATDAAGVPLLTLERLTFRFTTAGFLLLSLTLAAGIVSGAWRWDHKTVLTLLAWFTFALLLVGRLRFGWRGRKAVRVLYTGALLLLLGYAGSRFVLEVVLQRPA